MFFKKDLEKELLKERIAELEQELAQEKSDAAMVRAELQDKLVRCGKECLRLEEVTFKSQQDNRVYREKYELSDRGAQAIREKFNDLAKTHDDVCGKIQVICNDNDRLATLLQFYGIDPNTIPGPGTIGLNLLLRHHKAGTPLNIEDGMEYKLLVSTMEETGEKQLYWVDCFGIDNEYGLELKPWDETGEPFDATDDFWYAEIPDADDMTIPEPCTDCDADSDECEYCPEGCGEDEPW